MKPKPMGNNLKYNYIVVINFGKKKKLKNVLHEIH